VLWEICPDSVDSAFCEKLHRAVDRQQPVLVEEYYPPHGRWNQCRVYPSKDGVSHYFAGTTERKRTERALRDSERRLRMALDSGRMGIWYWDLQTDAAEWDERESQLLGLDHETTEKSGKVFLQCIHPEDVERLQADVAKCIEEGLSYESEFRVARGGQRSALAGWQR
jgi:PAS domain-containing protein